MAQDEIKPIRPITPDLLRQFHIEKGATHTACERCGNIHWALLSNEETPANGIPVAHDNDTIAINLFLPALVLSCTNCGNIWMISYQVIERWLDSRQEQGS